MSGSGPFINARKRAPIVLDAERACGSGTAAASGLAAASNTGAASPAPWTNSRLFVSLAIVLVPHCPPHLEFSAVRDLANNDVALRVDGNTMRVSQIARLVTRPPEC